MVQVFFYSFAVYNNVIHIGYGEGVSLLIDSLVLGNMLVQIQKELSGTHISQMEM